MCWLVSFLYVGYPPSYFQYYGHRTKLQVIGREDELEKLNRDALRIARKVADETGTLMAGNICNTCSFLPDNPSSAEKTKGIFKVRQSFIPQKQLLCSS